MIGFQPKKAEKKATESVLSIQSKSTEPKRKIKAFEIRLQKDIEELDDRWSKNFKFVDPDRMDRCVLSLFPDEGKSYIRNHELLISFIIYDKNILFSNFSINS